MSELLIVDYVADAVFDLTANRPPVEHLDIGAGPGDLIQRLRTRYPKLKSWAVDYNPGALKLTDVPFGQADLNIDRLPHEADKFDLVTCTEVFEHLENYRHALREAGRVLKPGGLFVVSTPNVLSLKSRWVFFTRGLFTFFDPLPMKDEPRFYAGQRHITPIPFFYLAHALLDNNFTEIQVRTDRLQRSSAFWARLLQPFLRFSQGRNLRRRRRRYFWLPDQVEDLAKMHNSWTVLTGRTLIVSARKKSPATEADAHPAA
jgi:SAM-dependent methyltransferase